jgi:hypothetical protein
MKMKLPIRKARWIIAAGLLLLIAGPAANAQLLSSDEFPADETMIMPTNIRFNVDPGNIQSRTVEVFNNSNEIQSYQISYQDFELTQEGQPQLMEAGECPHSLHQRIAVDPEKLELAPGETGEIRLTVTVPEGEENSCAAWGMVAVEPYAAPDRQPNEGAGLTSSVAYSVWLYQNSSESHADVDITNFIVGNKNRNKGVFLKVRNRGEGISVCNVYVEITNLKTGEQILIEDKQYTLLPGSRQTLAFDLEETLPKGSYSAVGKVNYSDQDELVATELEFKID